MKNLILTLIAVLSFSSLSLASDIIGHWKTIDDETGEAKSIVQIFKDGDEIKGKIDKLLKPKEPNPLCKECSGEKKNKPIEGLEIIWGLKSDGTNKWADGNVLDPQNGKTYSAKATLVDGGKKLELRGFIGVSLFGRTQTWHRVEESE